MNITMENLEKLAPNKTRKLNKEFITTLCLGVALSALLVQVVFVVAVKAKIDEIVRNNDAVLESTNELKSTLLDRNRMYADYILIDTSTKLGVSEKEKMKKELLEEIKKRR